VPSYLWPIVSANAPIIIQETTNNGDPNQRRINHLMRLDFDGDHNGANNDGNAYWYGYANATPTVYFSVAETADKYYIGYYFYHIRDNGTRAWLPNTDGHEHDLEGIFEVVEKSPYYPFGYSRLMLSQAHGAMLPYYSPNWFSQPPSVGWEQHSQGVINTWPDPNAVMRPVVAIRRNTHGTYLAQRCGPGQTPLNSDSGYGIYPERQSTDPFVACIHGDANAMVYLPGPYPCAPSGGCVINDVPTGASLGSYYYALTSLFDDQAFWPLRQTPGAMFGGTHSYLGGNQSGYLFFNGSGSDTEANPPWGWLGGPGQCETVAVVNVVACWYSYGSDDTENYWWSRVFWPTITPGHILTDPVQVAYNYWPQFSYSTSVIHNAFVGGAGSAPAPLSAYIDGPIWFNDFNTQGTWSAVVSGGTPPYTYQWSGPFYGTGSSVSGTVNESSILYLDVWDSAGTHVAYSTSLTRCPLLEFGC
jgi:hypothetical protein